MFSPTSKYDEVTFEDIKSKIHIIKNEDIEIHCTHITGIHTIIPPNAIELFIEEYNKGNTFLIDSQFYVYSSKKKFFTSDINNNNNEALNNKELSELDYFLHIYKNCLFSSESLQNENLKYLEHIVKEDSVNRFSVVKPYLDNLKITKSSQLTPSILSNMERLMTGIGLVSRLEFLKYIELIKKSNNYNIKINNQKNEHFIYTSMSMLISLIEKYPNFNDIFSKSEYFNDISILSHTNRVSIMFISFLHYYNNLFRKGLSTKLRLDYRNHYWNTYKKIVSHLNIKAYYDKLEHIFKLGIREFTNVELTNFAVASLYHDVALFDMLDFIPVKEVIGSHRGVHTTRAYHFAKHLFHQKDNVSIIVTLHHECYGYGFSPSKHLIKKDAINKKLNNTTDIINLLSFEGDDIVSGAAYSYFPAKIFEVIDIYDTLSYMKGKKQDSASSIIRYMKDSFLTDEIKIDPIVFDLFVQFLADIGNEDVLNYALI